jgi:predicted GNAT superfamily acetyltransferase
MVGYSLWYCGDAVWSAQEAAVLATMLQMPPRAMMLFLRLATRKQRFFPLARLRASYDADGTVRKANTGDSGSGDDGSGGGHGSESDDDGAWGRDDTAAVGGRMFFGAEAAAQNALDDTIAALEASGVAARIPLTDVIEADATAVREQAQGAGGAAAAAGAVPARRALPRLRDFLFTCCRVSELQEMLSLAGVDVAAAARRDEQARARGRGGGRGRGAAPAEAGSASTSRGGRGSNAPPPPRRGHRAEGRGMGIPLRTNSASSIKAPSAAKPLLVELLVKSAPTVAAGPWESVMGDTVQVSDSAVSVLQRVAEVFALLTGFAPVTATHGGSSPPPIPSTSAVLAAIRASAFPVRMPYVPASLVPSDAPALSQAASAHDGPSQPDGAAGEGLAEKPSELDMEMRRELIDPNADCPRPRRIAVFPTRRHLELCLEGQRLEQRLHYLTEDEGRRGRGTDEFLAEVMQLLEATRRGLRESEGLLASTAPLPDHTCPRALRAGQGDDSVHDESGAAWPDHETDIECLFLHRDLEASGVTGPLADGDRARSSTQGPYDHLQGFLPTYRFLRCASRLVDALEPLRRYDDALAMLRLVLTTRTEVRRKWHTDAAKAMMVKSRSAVFQLRKRGQWHTRYIIDLQHRNSAKVAVLHCELLYDVPVEAAPAEHAALVLPDEIRTSIRRADRLCVDRSMKKLYAPPRRWNALPDTLLLTQLRHAPDNTIKCKRDVGTRTWLNGADDSGRVESAALRWYMDGRGRKERGWQGMHCEGGWMSALFAVVLHDALFSTVSDDAAVFLSPFQTVPLDMGLPGVFYARRRADVDAALLELEIMSQGDFVDRVAQYRARHNGETSDFVPWDLQLTELAACVPLKPLAALFRALVKQEDGHYIRFSGVPDLCLYRNPAYVADSPDGVTATRKTFLLVEVKGPNDRLSEKQWAMNDLLLRCGFDVEMCYVVDDSPEAELAKMAASASAVTIVTDGPDDAAHDDGGAEFRARLERERRILTNRHAANVAAAHSRGRTRATPHSPTQL